jgi:hypothetical protein
MKGLFASFVYLFSKKEEHVQSKPLSIADKPQVRTLAELKKVNYQDLTEEERESFEKLAHGLVDFKHRMTHEIPKQYKLAFEYVLANFGWHIGSWMAVESLTPYLTKGTSSMNEYFISYLEKQLKELQSSAINRFPHRSRAIQLAFKSHQRGEYELSVPAFLILSEGIFRELTETDIFSKSVRKRSLKDKAVFIKSLKDNPKIAPLITHIIEAVINGEVIGLQFNNDLDIQTYPNVLHRNRIIHGFSYEYGTIENSFKAISQLDFIIEMVYPALIDN